MIRKLMVMLLSAVICFVGIAPVLAQGQYESLEAYEKATGKKIEEFDEAPMLRTLVAAGELDPVEKRLPEEPLIVVPLEEIGQYGGTVHTVNTWLYGFSRLIVGDSIFRIGPDVSTILPNIAKDWEYSEDGKTLTIYLRKGMKWSDGAPFTADDIMFWYEDILLNDKLVGYEPVAWSPGEELMQVEEIDDYTVRLNFAAPYPLAEMRLAHWEGGQAPSWGTYGGLFAPKHYLTQFHIKYNSEADELAKEEGLDHWYELFQNKAGVMNGTVTQPGLPTLSAYVCKEREAAYMIYERNPYYWKVDTEGNQLPYIDRYRSEMVESAEMVNAKITTGVVDFEGVVPTFDNYPLYKKYAEEGGYRVLLYDNSYSSTVWLQPNQTCKDPVLRTIFQDVRFRRALSLAIDREEVSEVLFFGLAEPRQASVLDDSMYFEPEFATAYIEYDLERANQLLDEMGLEWDKNHEYRLRPDGERLEAILEYVEAELSETPILEMVKEYWGRIGFSLTLKPEDGALLGTRAVANEIEIGEHQASGATDMMFLQWPLVFFPVKTGWEMTWAPAWGKWYETKGQAGEEPPAHIKRLQDIYSEMLITVDKDKQIELGKEACRAQAENLWTIGTVRIPCVLIATNNLRNIPEKGIYGWDGNFLYIYHPEQFFLKQD